LKNKPEIEVQNHLVENVLEKASGSKLIVEQPLTNIEEEPMELSNSAIIQVKNISEIEVHSFENLIELALTSSFIFEQPSTSNDEP
jgi:hypothetical protein